MSTSKAQEYNLFVENLIDCAYISFGETPQSRLLQEKVNKMEQDCDSILAPLERQFAEECFNLLYEVANAREIYLYKQGAKDCIWMLKNLGVLV